MRHKDGQMLMHVHTLCEPVDLYVGELYVNTTRPCGVQSRGYGY